MKVAELVGVEPAILSRKATGTAGKMVRITLLNNTVDSVTPHHDQ